MAKDKFDKFARQSRGRVSRTKTAQVNLLIVGEGKETEKLYFKAFPHKIDGLYCDVEYKQGKHAQPLHVVNTAIKYLRNKPKDYYNQVWVVFDRDDHPCFTQAINLAQTHGIKVAWTNEAFELWYILHFKDHNTAMPRTKYQQEIEKCVHACEPKARTKFCYEKNSEDMHKLINQHGSQKEAIERAKKLCKAHIANGVSEENANPCTTVHILVDTMTDPKKLTKLLKPSIS